MTTRLATLHHDESGQAAIMSIILLLVVFLLFAFAFDAGVWYFDHREAQNEAEAAALAAVQHLPSSDTGDAEDAVDDWLEYNRSGSAERSCLQFDDFNGDGEYDQVRVCVRRQSPAFFSKLAGLSSAWVSASATARVGAVDQTNVMPWAVVAPDPDCDEDANRNCLYDANNDGDYTDPGDCDAPFDTCPFGLTADRIYTFKAGTGGNTGILRVCGSGANDYRDCLSGDGVSVGFFEIGETVNVDLQPGTIANATDNGLQAREPASAWDIGAGGEVCDVDSYPYGPTTQSPGWDPDGVEAATSKFVNPTTNPQCAYRLVPIPIIRNLPPVGGGSVEALGFASFGVAKWYRANGASANHGADGSLANPVACHNYGNGQPDPALYDCGIVWGYLFSNVSPPDALLEQIGGSTNPFAPLLIALIE